VLAIPRARRMDARCALLAVLAIIALTASTACAAPAPPTPARSKPGEAAGAASGDKLLIGGVTALTGPQATFGEGARMGASLAAKEINARGGLLGRPIEMVYRDDEANPTKAVQVVQELISNQGVKAIIGPINTPNALAVAPAVSEAKVINLQITTGTATVDAKKHPTIFRPQYYAAQEAEVMLGYFVQTRGLKQLGLLADSTGYGQGGVAELKPRAEALGVRIVAEEKYNPGDADLTGQIGRILNGGAEGILAWGLGNDLAQAAKALEKLGWRVPMIGASGITTVGFRQLAGEAGRGHLGIYSRRFSFSDAAPAAAPSREFVEKLDAEYGTDWSAQTVVSAPWYEAVYLYAEAVTRAGSDDSAKVQQALEAIQGFPANGIYTTYTFGPEQRNGFQTEDLAVVFAAEERHGLYRRPNDAP
jgi:branched-chain amino acid transport system substrate-binding protein